MKISVVIPALNEEASIEATIRSVRDAGADEVIVVDGGSKDRTREIACGSADALIVTQPGRASQMNAGAEASTGDTLVFLHADTLFPPGAIRAVRDAMEDGSVVGGAFSVRLGISPSAPPYRKAILGLTGEMIGFRSSVFRAYTGDQAIFVRKEIHASFGGFPAYPLMEDVEYSRRLTRRGRTILLPVRITTSGRRWEATGPLRTILLMWGLRLGYFLGLSPATCAAIYGWSRER
ncbi:MAG: TIGR04283 family arsenosugar biosynthesis glycosyltransferase [Deltaproteobacteria bacterium]|nr:TIGR04283 family arsenosugar biosynthesis glycosyltransferase [Deltaproteobacteria bacterium]